MANDKTGSSQTTTTPYLTRASHTQD